MHMKMRKLFIGVSFFSLLVLGACEKGIPNIDKTDYFKEYFFDTKATAEQYNGIKNGINSGANNLSWVSIRIETYDKNNRIERYETGNSTIKILEDSKNIDHLIKKTTSSEQSQMKSGGITEKQSLDNETTQWDAGNGNMVEISKRNNEEEKVNSWNVSGGSNKDRKLNAITSLLADGTYSVDASNCYANKDGTFTSVVNSQITRNVTAVEWGTSTKEYIVESKAQTVAFYDKDYRLTSYYSYSEATTNRDISTGEWYDSVKLASFRYTAREYHYGTRESASISDLTKKANKLK